MVPSNCGCGKRPWSSEHRRGESPILARAPQPLQRFSHQERVQRVGGVIVRQRAQYLIAKFAVEPQSGLVIDCCFQVDLFATERAQSALAFVHQQRPQSQPARWRNNVEGPNAPRFSPNGVSNDEAGNCLCSCPTFGKRCTRGARIQCVARLESCLLYTSDAADEEDSV